MKNAHMFMMVKNCQMGVKMDFVSVLYVEENSLRKSAFLITGNGCAASAMSVCMANNI